MNAQRTKRIAVVFLAIAAMSGCEEIGEAAESPVDGAWLVVGITSTGPDSAANSTVQPGLFLFEDRHYSMMRVTGSQPRTLAAADSVTDAEKLAAYDSFIANSGTYEITDSTITTHPLVARSPNFMAGGSDKYTFRVRGDTLWLMNTGADLRSRIGGQLVAPSGPPSATTLVLLRQK